MNLQAAKLEESKYRRTIIRSAIPFSLYTDNLVFLVAKVNKCKNDN
jgi:hypothetical protein